MEKLPEKNLYRPYKLNEIAELEREMKALTFERILANNEECPEGLLPSGVDSKSYMRKYIEAKRQDDLLRSNKPPVQFCQRESSVEIEEITEEPVVAEQAPA